MITQQQVVQRFRSRLVCRDDHYLRHDGASWERVRGPVTDRVLLAHLARRECIALAPAKNWSLIWAAINFNAHGIQPKQLLQGDVLATLEQLEYHGIGGHIVESGRGYHLWVFLEEPCSAKATQVLLERLTAGDHEVYAGDRAIRLPLGAYHDDRDIFWCFLGRTFEPVEDQRDYLVDNTTPASVDALQEAYEQMMRRDC